MFQCKIDTNFAITKSCFLRSETNANKIQLDPKKKFKEQGMMYQKFGLPKAYPSVLYASSAFSMSTLLGKSLQLGTKFSTEDTYLSDS